MEILQHPPAILAGGEGLRKTVNKNHAGGWGKSLGGVKTQPKEDGHLKNHEKIAASKQKKGNR